MKHEDREKIEFMVDKLRALGGDNGYDLRLLFDLTQLHLDILLDIRDHLNSIDSDQGKSKWSSKL